MTGYHAGSACDDLVLTLYCDAFMICLQLSLVPGQCINIVLTSYLNITWLKVTVKHHYIIEELSLLPKVLAIPLMMNHHW